MRRILGRFGVVGMMAFLLTSNAVAGDSGTYFHFDVGPNFLQDANQRFDDGTELDREFSTGVRGSIAQGYDLKSWLAIELESGFSYNELKGGDDWLGNVPFLASVVFRYDAECGWTPFIGVGGGGSLSIAKTSVANNDSDMSIVPAWQGMAGLRYRFGQDFGVGVVYKYFGTGSAEFELFGTEFKLRDVHNHYVGLQMHYDF